MSAALEKRLWDTADQFRANSSPILGIIFLRFAEVRFTAQRARDVLRCQMGFTRWQFIGIAASASQP